MTAAIKHVLRIGLVVLAGACLCAPRPCAAENAAPAIPAWLEQVTLNGFLGTSYSYNSNRPASGTNQLRVFDFDDNTFKLDEFELVVQHAAGKPRESGFRVDFTVGSSEPRVAASAGLFRDASGQAQDFDVHQAYASYVAPVGSGLRFDLGKFITAHGAEVIDGYDGWNDNATRSLLFGYAIPFTHVGVRASATFTPKASAVLMVVNGWDVARDNNRAKSVGGQLALTPLTPLTVYLSAMTGAERAGNDGDPRSLLDVVAILKAGSRVTFGANGDWGMEEGAVAPGVRGRWKGYAGYSRLAIGGPLALCLRGEYFADPDGVRTGTRQFVSEFTVTPELRISPRIVLRADVRMDRSNIDVFEKDQKFTDSQTTALIEALYSF